MPRYEDEEFLLLQGDYNAYIASLAPVSWWDAATSTLYQDDGATTPAIADNDPVGYITDKINGAFSAAQANPAIRPNLKLNIQNGLRVVRFAVGDILATSAPIVTGMDYTLIFAFKYSSGTLPWYNGVSGGGGASGYGAYFDGNRNILMGGVAAKVDGVSTTNPEILVLSHTSGASKLYVNGVSQSITSAAINPTVPVTVMTSVGIDSAIDLFECVMFDRQLTDAEVDRASDLCGAKWGVY